MSKSSTFVGNEFHDFSKLPSTYQKMIFRACIFQTIQLCEDLADVGITAANICFWQTIARDATNRNIPIEILDTKKVDITRIDWVIPSKTPSKLFDEVRKELRIQRKTLGRQGTSLERASLSFLVHKGLPSAIRQTILRQLRREEKAAAELTKEQAAEAELQGTLARRCPCAAVAKELLPSLLLAGGEEGEEKEAGAEGEAEGKVEEGEEEQEEEHIDEGDQQGGSSPAGAGKRRAGGSEQEESGARKRRA
ncbi:uncharacterized protein EV422DRAFT_424848 [Fimicolochytrium jonesii]|uniref:uncharacterized protein n=1 Tax=Fimicolochytrium jonesii TaxID=1396493 RepID=UPI0022FE7380|nr:uncharacterized protein EV422DRAFT_424848 [Fimicolochytrium jonesii]KAI8821636.1 hypothetical protein EV422DRAFT_424848 [Fimicolochytrium jonesii]